MYVYRNYWDDDDDDDYYCNRRDHTKKTIVIWKRWWDTDDFKIKSNKINYIIKLCVVFLFFFSTLKSNANYDGNVQFELQFHSMYFCCRYCFIFWSKHFFPFHRLCANKTSGFLLFLLYLIETIVNLIKSLMSRCPCYISYMTHTHKHELHTIDSWP